VFSVAISSLLVMSFSATATLAGSPAATNDAFASATVIAPGSLPYEDDVDASAATGEVDEEDARCDVADGDSIWYTITPAFSGALRADTIGTNSGNSGGDLTIYEGTTLLGLNEIACNTSLSDASSSARVTFRVTSGVQYYIRVTDTHSTTVFHLRRVSRPANDDFARAKKVRSLPLRIRTTNLNATFEANEPDTEEVADNCSTNDPTIWYSIKPTHNMVLRASVVGAIDTVLAVWTGTSLGSLTLIGCNDDTGIEGQGYSSNVAWRAQGGTRYYIQVGGYEGETGPLMVNIVRGNPPANDNFANAETIMADNALHSLKTTKAATIEIVGGEPDPSDCGLGGTVWYEFVAPATGDYLVETWGSEFSTAIAIYTGSSLNALSEVDSVCSEGAHAFSATMGTTYFIQVGGNGGDSGNLHVRLLPD
jgi:hypothetical protein